MPFTATAPLWKGKHVELVRDSEHGFLTVEHITRKVLHNPPGMPHGDWGTAHLGHFLYENWVQHSNRRLQREEPEVWAEIVEELNQVTLTSLAIQENEAVTAAR